MDGRARQGVLLSSRSRDIPGVSAEGTAAGSGERGAVAGDAVSRGLKGVCGCAGRQSPLLIAENRHSKFAAQLISLPLGVLLFV